MKIILSHDVDHLYWSEHYFRDMALPFTLFRNSLGFAKGQINFNLYLKRLKMYGRLHRIPELIKFYEQYGLKAHFFFGMDNALRLSYNYKDAEKWVKFVLEKDHGAGVHGLEVRDFDRIKNEYNRFKELSGLDHFGVRTHYLRLSGYTHEYFKNTGYLFDSSIQGVFKPVKIADLWEIPMSLMDASLVSQAQLNQNMSQWKEATLKLINTAQKSGQDTFVVNMHDTYFDPQLFPVIYDWYCWLIDYFFTNKYSFSTFATCVENLEKKP